MRLSSITNPSLQYIYNKSLSKEQPAENSKLGQSKVFSKVLLVGSWIPVIGAIVGAYYLSNKNHTPGIPIGHHDPMGALAEARKLKYRGWIQVASLGVAGPVLLLLDVISSIFPKL
ncbi:MAG: hypothetical protein S4CHLAM123_04070 [Chlamydiales bacterium]|nr:hypothetical protein [Chlamydiales bacterium]